MATKEKRNSGLKDGLKLKNGIYHYRFMHRGELHQGSCRCTDLKTAQKYITKVRSELILNDVDVRVDKQPTFADAFDYYIKSRSRILTEKSILSAKSNMEHHWSPFAKVPIRNIQPHIDDLHVRLIEKGLAPATIRCILVRLGSVLERSKKGGLHNCPYTIPKVQVVRDPKTALSEEEIETFFGFVDAIATPEQKVMARTLYYLGLRISDCLRASWDDLCEEDMTYRIDERQKNGEILYLPVLPEMARWFATLTRRPGELIFPGKGKEGRHDPGYTARLLERASDRMGLKKKITHHRLRASLCTNLLRRGVALPVVMQILRHKDSEVTLGHYWEGRMKDMRDGISALDKPTPESTPGAPVIPLQVHRVG